MSPSNGNGNSNSSANGPSSTVAGPDKQALADTTMKHKAVVDDDDDSAPSSSSSTLPTLSTSMVVCVCYFMHGIVNSLLLSPWCPARASFWNVPPQSSNPGQDWMLRWLSLTVLQLHLLLAAWAVTAVGNVLLEQRLVALTATLLVASLTAGVSFVPHLNSAMASLQAVIYGSLLAVMWWDQTNWNSTIRWQQQQQHPLFLGWNNNNNNASAIQAWRTSSFDARRRLPLVTLATALLSVVQWLRVVDMTWGGGKATYVHHTRYQNDAVFVSISDMAYQHMLWVALVLSASVVGALPAQQKVVLRGNALVLLVTLGMLAGRQGEDIEPAARRAGVVGSFASIVVSVVGSL